VKRAYPRSRWRSGAAFDLAVIDDIVLHVYSDQNMQWHCAAVLYLETVALLAWRWLNVEALAERLLRRETLMGNESEQVIRDAVRARIGWTLTRDAEHP
jgi:hypothetical protein